MIKFFRKIRQSLLFEGKTGKYFKYAIGEIFLVVIGILIALQVNNWNENRKSVNSQNELLEKLTFDLDHDISRFEEIDSIYNNDLEEVQYVIEESLTGRNTKLNSTRQMVAGRGSALYLTITKSTFEEMVNSGLFYQIPNEILKSKITSYYELADFLLEKENRDNQNLNNWVMGIKNKDPKWIIMRLREQNNLEYVDWSWLQNPKSEMYKNQESFLIWLKAAMESNKSVMKRLISEANNLKSSIRTYLDE